MKDKPLVSILMTVYNREKYIEEAIQSVIGSTYQNWELIVVDDRSKDNSVEIAREYESKDNRIKVYINEKNLGDYPNRNQAARYANGKYLKYLDADDLIYPYGMELLMFYMEHFPDAGYGICSLAQDNELIYPFQLSPVEAYRRHYIQNKWVFHKAPLSVIIKRDAFIKTGGFTGKQHLGDFELWNILSREFNVVLMPDGIVWYRNHPDQQNTDNKTNPSVNLKYLVLEKEILENKNCPLRESEKKNAIKRCLKKQSRYVLSHAKSHGIFTFLKLLKKSDLNLYQVFVNAFK